MQKVRNMVIWGLLGAILVVAQVSLAFLPNIEIVSILLIVMTICIGRAVLAPLIVFIVLEGLIYGVTMWWFNYLYIWPLLCLLAHCFHKQRSPLFWAICNGIFGLLFGALCALPYLLIGGPGSALAYWINGVYFDLLHCAGNFFTALCLFQPLLRLFEKLLADMHTHTT